MMKLNCIRQIVRAIQMYGVLCSVGELLEGIRFFLWQCNALHHVRFFFKVQSNDFAFLWMAFGGYSGGYALQVTGKSSTNVLLVEEYW